VNKGNLQFEFDQVHIICPVYEPGTFENETEKYIIYNVSKVEYETCRITNANPRIIAICDKPQKLMFFTITFRPFTPQPGGLEFLPGNDYYFISTSSKDDLHRRIGGRCSTNNMKVVFKVCCSPDELKNTTTLQNLNNNQQNRISTGASGNNDQNNNNGRIVPQIPNINTNISNVVQSTMSWPSWSHPQSTPISSTLSVQPFYPYMTSPRPNVNSAVNNNNNYNSNNNNNNNSPSHKPTKKTSEYDKHPNEVVKNEELTYSNAANSQYNYKTLCNTMLYTFVSLTIILVPPPYYLNSFSHIPLWCQR
jgi:ephrin-B